MRYLSNMKIGGKLLLLAIGGVVQLSCVAGLALWSLSDAGTAAAKAQHYAHRMDLSERLDSRQNEIALRVIGLRGAMWRRSMPWRKTTWRRSTT